MKSGASPFRSTRSVNGYFISLSVRQETALYIFIQIGCFIIYILPVIYTISEKFWSDKEQAECYPKEFPRFPRLLLFPEF